MPAKPSKQKEFEKLTQSLMVIFESGFINKRELFKTSFMRGVLTGFGGVIGATVMIAILVWVLSLFSSVPLLGRFLESLQHSLNAGR